MEQDSVNVPRPGDYILVGGTYYKKIRRPEPDGSFKEVLQDWSRSRLALDFKGRSAERDKIERFDAFCNLPCNTPEYQQRILDSYNLYEKVPHVPSPGPWPTIQKLLEHIFGEQYTYGLDYLQLLYLRPTQKLPILVLVSRERSTGKSTFLNFLKDIFGGNVSFSDNGGIRSKFNADWAGKLVLVIDEALLNRREDSEQLKHLSTAETWKMEAKGKDRTEIHSYIKIIISSNNIADPIFIDKEEDRYWVREIPHLPVTDVTMKEKMQGEIPAFLHFLFHRSMVVPVAESRMWFSPRRLETSALLRIKNATGPRGEKEMAEFLLDTMDILGVDKLCFTWSDLQLLAENNHFKWPPVMHGILRHHWQIEQAPNKLAYDRYMTLAGQPVSSTSIRAYGRYYTFTRILLQGVLGVPSADDDDLPPD